jgi:threonine dehydratase
MEKQELLDCHQRIKPFIHRTAVLSSQSINNKLGLNVFFKCENFQRAGAYKMRGATNAILQLSQKERNKGVVTHSSGNFAQAVSLAAKSLNVKAHIVMPTSAPQVKKIGVAAYGGKIYECEPTLRAREENANRLVAELGATLLHPSNDLDVIIGQGTAAIELLEEVPNLNTIFCPVGGGGLIAGSALAAMYFGKDCKVYGGEPFEADDAYRSLQSGKIEGNESTNTIADGLKTTLGNTNFPIIKEHVNGIIRVTEEEIISAMRLVWERMKIIIEPSSAVTLAALIRDKENFQNQDVGIIISGGNVDLQNLPF